MEGNAMTKFTDAEIEQHRIEFADALIEHADEQIVGEYILAKGVCAVGCAVQYTGLQRWIHEQSRPDRIVSMERLFAEYFELSHYEIVELNERVTTPEFDGRMWSSGRVVNKTFPEIADIVKNWKDEYDPSAE
jgi:hypothetical protein